MSEWRAIIYLDTLHSRNIDFLKNEFKRKIPSVMTAIVTLYMYLN